VSGGRGSWSEAPPCEHRFSIAWIPAPWRPTSCGVDGLRREILGSSSVPSGPLAVGHWLCEAISAGNPRNVRSGSDGTLPKRATITIRVVNALRVLGKAAILAAVLGALWGTFYWVASRGSISHAIQAAWILGALVLLVVPVVVIFLRRARQQIPNPSLSRILIVGGFLSIAQGFVVGAFTSLSRGAVAAGVMLIFFFVGARLGWFLLSDEGSR